MIIVKNRELLIPETERYIGTTYDHLSENRQFKLPRVAQNGVDLSALTFRLDLKYANDTYDTVILSKEIEGEYIVLTWEILSAVQQVPGTLYIALRATDGEAAVRWASFGAVMYVERHLNTPGNYGGDLTEIEQMELDHQYFKSVIQELGEHLDYAHDAEAWATGNRNGEAVPSTDETYHNNAKYYKDQAANGAGSAKAFSLDAEAWAKGTREGTAVTSGQDGYHDNAKYYAAQAAATVDDTNTRFNNAMAAVTVDTEVVDARVGVKGSAYTALKVRLDSEHNDLQNQLDKIGVFVSPDVTWESGSIYTSTGQDYNSNTCIRTGFFKLVSDRLKITFPTDFYHSADLFIYNSESISSYVESAYTHVHYSSSGKTFDVPAGKYCRVVYEETASGGGNPQPEDITLVQLVRVDETLTQSGAAADAKVTGDAIRSLNSNVGNLSQLITEDNSSLVAAINEVAENADAGLSDDAKLALLACFRKVAWIDDQGQACYDTLYDSLFPSAVSISATFTPGSHVFYETDTLDALRPYLVVRATMPDSSVRVVTNYILTGSMSAGANTITVRCQGLTDTFTVTVVENPAHITANYTDSVVYSDDSLDSLKRNLVVTYYANNTAPGVVLSDADYTLSGTLAGGVSTIIVVYDVLVASFDARVIGVESYNYSSDLSDWNLSGTTVSYSNGKIYMHPANPNNWSCRATDPKKTLWDEIKHKLIRVRFSAYSPNWTGDFSNENPYNEVAFGVGVYSSKAYTGATRLRYTDVANTVLTSTVQNFDAVFYTQYNQEEELTAENSFGGYIFAATSNELYITDCKIQKISAYPVVPVLLNASFNSPYVNAGTTLSQLRSNLTVTSYNSDTTTSTVNDYTLSGSLPPGKNIITVTYNGLTTTFEVAVVSELFSGTYFVASNDNGVTIDRSPVRYHTDSTNGACVYGSTSGSHSSVQRYSSAQVSGITLYPFAIPSSATKLVFNSNGTSARVNILRWNTSSNDWECVSPDDWQSLVNAFNLSEYRTTYGNDLYVIFSLSSDAVSANKTNWFFGWA